MYLFKWIAWYHFAQAGCSAILCISLCASTEHENLFSAIWDSECDVICSSYECAHTTGHTQEGMTHLVVVHNTDIYCQEKCVYAKIFSLQNWLSFALSEVLAQVMCYFIVYFILTLVAVDGIHVTCCVTY